MSFRCSGDDETEKALKLASVSKGFITILVCASSWTWNVRTMFATGKLALGAAEMNKNNLALLDISETRQTNAGQR